MCRPVLDLWPYFLRPLGLVAMVIAILDSRIPRFWVILSSVALLIDGVVTRRGRRFLAKFEKSYGLSLDEAERAWRDEMTVSESQGTRIGDCTLIEPHASKQSDPAG